MRIHDFALPGSDGATHTLSEWRSRHWIAYFYPKDNTGGCTAEAISFRDAVPALRRLGVDVVGISPDSIASHCRFIQKHALPFLLLSDPDHALAKAMGVWAQKTLYGRSFMGIVRSTFLVGLDGEVAREWRKVKVAGHANEVVEAARAAVKAARAS